MNDEQLLRYSRHILLPEIGIEGQERLRAARALIVGAGGLGCPAALYLAAGGVGRLTLADGDKVDLTNLQRQILHRTESVGTPKVEAARAALTAVNPEVAVVALPSGSTRQLDELVAQRRRGARLHRQLRHAPCGQPRVRAAPQAAGVGRRHPLRRPGRGVRPAERRCALLHVPVPGGRARSRKCGAR